MTKTDIQELFPIEVTTQNLYFHEEASIFSVDSFSDLISTGGGDGIVRLWRLSDVGTKKEGDFRYTTALTSSIKIVYVCDIIGHNKAVNCVRFSDNGILASASDGGKVILYYQAKSHILREFDGLDCYEILWTGDKLVVGLSNGILEEYTISYTDVFSCKFLKSFSLHSDIIQGLSYNKKHSLILSVSKDRTAKLSLNSKVLENYPLFTKGRSFFRRATFSKSGDLAYLCNVKNNSVLVVNYPFTEDHWVYKFGPFNSEIVKILENDEYLFIFSKTSLYIFKEGGLLASIDNICFKSVTDATVNGNLVLISSLDGFISSLKWK